MRKIKAIAIDDNQSALSIIEKLSKETGFIDISSTFLNAVEAGKYLKSNDDIDIIFLDVNMPDMTGLEFIKTYKPKQSIIFISKHTEHAVDSYNIENEYNIKVIDFLPLPVDKVRFIRACNKALESIIPSLDSIVLKDNKKEYKVKFDSIILIEADKDDGHLMHVYLNTQLGPENKEELIIRKSLEELESELPPKLFVRVSKKAIVNIEKVQMLEEDDIITTIPKKRVELKDKWKAKFETMFGKRK